MGNTGAYMLRWRNWKYIAFGHTFDTFSVGNGYAACWYAQCVLTQSATGSQCKQTMMG
jgi:hypothetical protein